MVETAQSTMFMRELLWVAAAGIGPVAIRVRV